MSPHEQSPFDIYAYQQSPFDIIEGIRRNLQDRYKDCHAVLKELLQNADDAGASELQIAWLPFLDDAHHPLLQGPLLLIANNAPFTFRDAHALHLPGRGSKALEESKIGKFGLGLKSVFHLCEAFFYMSDVIGDAAADKGPRRYPRTGLVNPWGRERYSAWNRLSSEDETRLRRTGEALLASRGANWFGLCLPLRRKEHCKEESTDDPANWAIDPRYYGDDTHPPDDIFSPRRIASIRQMLPLMSTLNSVRFVVCEKSHKPTARVLAALVRTPIKHADWRTMHVGCKPISGRIADENDHGAPTVNYGGMQQLLALPELECLSARDGWPRMDSQTSKGLDRGPVRAKQHVAVVVLEQAGEGCLRVDRAVFLPLGDPPQPEYRSVGQHDFELMLHGYFFVDAGRLGVDFAASGEAPTVRQEWNRTLYQTGTLRLVIPALAEFARAAGDSESSRSTLSTLTEYLSRSALWRDYQAQVCFECNWVMRVLPNGHEWCAVPSTLPIIRLPRDEKVGAPVLFDLFPALRDTVDRLVISIEQYPLLARAESTRWPDGIATQMLASVRVEDVGYDDSKLKYLSEALRCLCDQGVVGRDGAIRDLVRRLLMQVPLAELRKRKDAIVGVVNRLPRRMRLTVPHKSSLMRESERVFGILIGLGTSTLPVPDFCVRADEDGGSEISDADASTMLQALSGLQPKGAQEDEFVSLVNDTLVAICGAWKPKPTAFLEGCADLRLFYAKNYKSDSRVALTARQMSGGDSRSFLFGNSASLCQQLQACLPAHTVTFVNSPLLAFVPGEVRNALRSCDTEGCAAVLLQEPVLSHDAAPRASLLKRLLAGWPSGPDASYRRAVRYLLHATPGGEIGHLPLFVDGSGAWQALIRCILAARGQLWRLIPIELTSNVPPSQAHDLRLEQGDAGPAVALLHESVPAGLDCTEILKRTAWRDQIVRECPPDAHKHLRQLPIFERVDGVATTITSQTFIKGDFPPPPRSIFPEFVLIVDPTGAIEAAKLAPTLERTEVLKRALNLEECHKHWRFILDSVPDQLSTELHELLRTRPWIPGVNGIGVAPHDVICRNELAPFVRELRESHSPVCHTSDLPHDVLTHSQWHIVEGLCARGEHLYQMLGNRLRHAAAFAIGVDTVRDESLEFFLEVFTSEGGRDVMPGASLIDCLRRSGLDDPQWIGKYVLPAVKSVLDVSRTQSVLQYLSAQHEKAEAGSRKWLVGLYNRFLEEGLEQAETNSILAGLRLLNKENRWTASTELALRGTNIAASNLLHQSHVDVLESSGRMGLHAVDSVSKDGLRALVEGRDFKAGELAASAAVLEEYLQEWRSDDVPDDALAVIVAMLGDQDGYPELYERLQVMKPLDSMRNQFGWHNAVTGHWGQKELMGKQHFCIRPAEANAVIALNLVGKKFKAAVSRRLTALFDGFDGRTYFPMPLDDRCYLLRLRRIDPVGLSTEEKLEILFNTLRDIRSIIHGQADENLSIVWDAITHTGQLDIQIAQRMILEASAALLDTQLSVRESERLKAIFKRWHRARHGEASAEQTKNQRELEAARRQKEQVLGDLRDLLMTDASTQQLIMGEICERLRAVSYDAASIPFELFQNADDAVAELEALCGDGQMLSRVRPDPLRRCFMVELAEDRKQKLVRFIHWGRGINQYRIGATERAIEEFQHDLERMLVLQGSGKEDSDRSIPRTGKFGLGFKSVLFVSKEPRVLSGPRSRFRVLGGLFPAELSKQDAHRLEAILEELGDAGHKGTVVELPLKSPEDQTAMLRRFREWAGYLVVFARRIKDCSVGAGDGRASSWSWRAHELRPGIECGEVQVGLGKARTVLVLRSGIDRYRAVLFPLGPSGFVADEVAGIPEVWVTCPTSETLVSRGLLLNGPFDLNPGRTTLRETERNSDIAFEMGRDLGDQLVHLYEAASSDWSSISKTLRLTTLSPEDFWSSLWVLCSRYLRDDDKSSIGHLILFGSALCGMARLVQDADAIPTGLTGRYECNTSLARIRWYVSGMLDRDDVWSDASTHPWVVESMSPGSVIADFTAAQIRCFSDVRLKKLILVDILRGAIGDNGTIEPPEASRLGKIVFRKRLDEMAGDASFRSEHGDIEELLGTIEFRSAANGWSPAKSLISAHDEEDRDEEHRCAALAPATRVLSSEYVGDALGFFRACRKRMDVTADDLIAWIRQAEGAKRRAALAYLKEGNRRSEIERRSKKDLSLWRGSWLEDSASRNEAMSHLDTNDQAMLMGTLGKADTFLEEHQKPRSSASPEPEKSRRNAADILADILAWWRKDRARIISTHDRKRYPNGCAPQLTFSASEHNLNEDVAIRKEWLRLMMLGAMHRIGRAKIEQHRGFLEKCEEHKWLDILAAPSGNPQQWLTIMDDYLDRLQGDAPYYHWMNQFLSYYQLARWLPSYIRAFDAVTRPGVNLARLADIHDIVNLRTTHIFARSTGFDAPPCSRTMGLGAHFILREVIRLRAAQDKTAVAAPRALAQMAFVPSKPVRTIMYQVTGNNDFLLAPQSHPRSSAASLIWKCVSQHLNADATFDMAFDIPLLMLGCREFQEERERILGDAGEACTDAVDFLDEDSDSEVAVQ